MEKYFNFTVAIIVIGNLLDCIILANMMNAFLGKRKLHQSVIRIAYGLFYALSTASVFCSFITWQYCAFYLFLLFLLTFFYEEAWEKRIWVVLTLGSIRLSCLLLVFLAEGRVFYAPEICMSASLFLLCFVIMKRIPFEQNDEDIGETSRLWRVLLLLVSAASTAALFGLLHETKVSALFAVICCICFLIIDLSTFLLYHAVRQNAAYVKQRDSYRQLLHYYKNQIEVIVESQNNIRALRHDMKNHLLHLRIQLENKKYEDALCYLNTMTENMKGNMEYVSTGNTEADCLLNYKIRIAKKVLKKVEYQIQIPVDCEWKSFDFNIVMGNLLDNALEAAQDSEEKFLKIVIHVNKGILLIHVANSYKNIPNRQGKQFLSTKQESDTNCMKEACHGIGLQNVKRIVEKQNGDMELHYGNGLFEADVMLYLNQL